MNIVTAYNERPESRRALDWILTHGPQLAGSHDKVHLHVALTSGADSPASPNYGSPTLADALTTELEATNIAHTIHPAGPDAAAQMLDLAEQERADLVVIGMRRRSATMKLLLGSQVQRVVLDAPCPVVTVKSDADRPKPVPTTQDRSVATGPVLDTLVTAGQGIRIQGRDNRQS